MLSVRERREIMARRIPEGDVVDNPNYRVTGKKDGSVFRIQWRLGMNWHDVCDCEDNPLEFSSIGMAQREIDRRNALDQKAKDDAFYVYEDGLLTNEPALLNG